MSLISAVSCLGLSLSLEFSSPASGRRTWIPWETVNIPHPQECCVHSLATPIPSFTLESTPGKAVQRASGSLEDRLQADSASVIWEAVGGGQSPSLHLGFFSPPES